MRHMVFSTKTTPSTTTTTTTMPLLSGSSSAKPKSSNPNSSSSPSLCKHSPSATLDVLILLLVLFSGTFLLTSYFSYIFNSLSLLLAAAPPPPPPQFLGFLAFFLLSSAAALLCCGGAAAAARSRRCHRPGCEGLKKAMEFDLKLQSEEALRSSGGGDFDRLPWKGGGEGNPDYECLRSELRKMAPPNGRAVLLFRARCGCPVAKLEGWGPKRAAARRHKKS